MPKPSKKDKNKVVVEGPVAERLRTWRRQRAADDEVPAFVVFNDKTLAELVRVQPRTRRDLLTVSGIGPAKADRYGKDILEVLSCDALEQPKALGRSEPLEQPKALGRSEALEQPKALGRSEALKQPKA